MKEAKAREGIGVMLYTKKLKIFTGNANPELAKEIAAYLGIGLGDVQVSYFSDGEIGVTINESVRGADVFVIQPTCPPTNKNVMELLIMIDALKRASARRICAVLPYYGYAARQSFTPLLALPLLPHPHLLQPHRERLLRVLPLLPLPRRQVQ
jgi:hypothetical protein